MSTYNENYLKLVKLILPEELFDYFDLINLEIKDNEIHAYLEEMDIKHLEYKDEKLSSKEFHLPIVVQNFPIRKKPLFLHIKSRRRLKESSVKVVKVHKNKTFQ